MRHVRRGRSAALAGLVLALPILGVGGWLLKDRVVEEVILRRMARSHDNDLWTGGMAWLAERGSARAIPELLRFVAEEPLLGVYYERPDPIVGICRREGDRAVLALARMLLDENLEIRRQAALSLVRVGPYATAARSALKQALGDPSMEVRVLAATGLIEQGVGAEECLPVFLEALWNPEPEEYAMHAAMAIGRLGKRGAPAVPDLIRMLKSGRDGFHELASDCLLQIGEAAVDPLKEFLHQGGSMAATAGFILGKLGREEAIPHVLSALRSEDHELRWKAIHVLGSLGSEARSAISLLEEIAHRQQDGLAFLAKCALAVIDPDGHPPVPRLLERALDPADERQSEAETALGMMGFDASRVGPVIEALHLDDLVMQRTALTILGGARGDTSRARAALLEAGRNWHWSIRSLARESLAALDRHAARTARAPGTH